MFKAFNRFGQVMSNNFQAPKLQLIYCELFSILINVDKISAHQWLVCTVLLNCLSDCQHNGSVGIDITESMVQQEIS